MFDNVNFDFYKNSLGRSVIPDAVEFEKYELENKLYIKKLVADRMLEEREINGIDSACCMMIEEDYLAAQTESGANAPDISESINGYSHSIDLKAHDLFLEKNQKSVAEKKYKWLSLFCVIFNGVR